MEKIKINLILDVDKPSYPLKVYETKEPYSNF